MNWIQQQEEDFEHNRFGMMAIMLVVQGCLGAIAAMYSLTTNSMWLMGVAAITTMSTVFPLLASLPTKWCIKPFLIGVFINAAIIVINLVMQ